MDVALLVAVAENGAIGKDNQLLWRLRDDLKHFKARTLDHVVIMGRKTFESIGSPLPGRTNVVLSRNSELQIPGTVVFSNLQDALQWAQQHTEKDEVFVIGGAEIYQQAVPFATKLYLTLVKANPEGDSFFDLTPYKNWETAETVHYAKSERNQHAFTLLTLQKPS